MNIEGIRALAHRLCDQHYQIAILACAGISMGCPSEFHGGSGLVQYVVNEIRAEFNGFWNYEGSDIGRLYDSLVDAHGARGKQRFLSAVMNLRPDYYPPNDGHRALIKLYLEVRSKRYIH